MIIAPTPGWQRWFAWHPTRAYLVEPSRGIHGWCIVFWQWVERQPIPRTMSGVRYAYRLPQDTP